MYEDDCIKFHVPGFMQWCIAQFLKERIFSKNCLNDLLLEHAYFQLPGNNLSVGHVTV